MTAQLPSPSPRPYVGRFAPSPSGPLHFGSLVAAFGSWLAARAAGGRWLLRIEDVDTGRSQAGADALILADLARFGLVWDGTPSWQSQRSEAYHAALARLQADGLVFPCACSRREIGDSQLAPDGSPRYPGTCRQGLAPGREGRAWRLNTAGAGRLVFDDAVQGPQQEDLEQAVGDFVLRRADGLFAYQLAVVVDDAEQAVSEVVRGADLLSSSPRQIYLQRCLGYPQPRYAHLPVALNAAGEKLSKQTRARALSGQPERPLLLAALRFLGQPVHADMACGTLPQLLDAAVQNWQMAQVPRCLAAPAPLLE